MTQQYFLETLKQTQDLIWPVVEKYIHESLDFPDFCRIDQKYQSLIDFQKSLLLEYPKRKGKYLRPALLLSTALSIGANIDKALLPAVAMQLSEEWILIHDDVEDNSEQRRGFPALQRIYGSNLAFNAGDALHVVMWKVIGDIHNQLVYNEFYQLLKRTTFGQTIDLKWNQDNKLDIVDDDIFLILEGKTGYYTISGPMRLGAIVAGATDSELNTIYQFGRYLGLAFQIIDDILDLTSDFSGLKKQQYNDIYEGKRTIPLSHLLQSVTSGELARISAIFSKTRDQKTESEVLEIITLMNKYRSIEQSRQIAVDFSIQAKKILAEKMSFIKIEPYRQQLESAIDFIVNRVH